MEKRVSVLFKVLTVGVALWMIVSSSGCQKAAVKELEPVFFPGPPNKPRLQFLTSFAGSEKFDVDKASFLETFVLGEEERKGETIFYPYGVAIHDGKIYVCDPGNKAIKVLDLVNNKFSVFPSGRSIQNPVNIFIEEDGTKYVADMAGGAISVWNSDDKLVAFMGKELGIEPRDVVVRGERVYLTDVKSNQVLVLDKRTGRLVQRIGKEMTDKENWGPGEFAMITDLTLDGDDNVYVGDKYSSRLTKFDSEGKFLQNYGRRGSAPDSLIRAKGIAVDREDRVWVVDAGPATAVKVFRNDGQILMMFGFLGQERGQMYLPAKVIIDYDHVDLFQKYAVEGAELEFIVLVTNQFGRHKVSVYGFGKFPDKYTLSLGARGDGGEESATDDDSSVEKGDGADAEEPPSEQEK